jgi:hypothetical protein
MELILPTHTKHLLLPLHIGKPLFGALKQLDWTEDVAHGKILLGPSMCKVLALLPQNNINHNSHPYNHRKTPVFIAKTNG